MSCLTDQPLAKMGSLDQVPSYQRLWLWAALQPFGHHPS